MVKGATSEISGMVEWAPGVMGGFVAARDDADEGLIGTCRMDRQRNQTLFNTKESEDS